MVRTWNHSLGHLIVDVIEGDVVWPRIVGHGAN